MVRRLRALLGATTLGFATWSLASCGGQSQVTHDDDSPAGAGNGGSSSSGGSGGGTGATGGTSSSGGAAGSVSAGTGGTGVTPDPLDPGCDVGGIHYDEGQSWPNDCNTCWCKAGGVACTMALCQPASGGASGTGGTGGAGSGGTGTSGMAGEGGASSCELADIGSFCVVPNRLEIGTALVDGMQLGLELRPAGCYSSSCTKLVSSSCNYIGMNGEYSITPFVCLATEGEACTDDCGGGGSPLCYPNLILHTGTYAINIAGTSAWVKFEVPSTNPSPAELCSTPPIDL